MYHDKDYTQNLQYYQNQDYTIISNSKFGIHTLVYQNASIHQSFLLFFSYLIMSERIDDQNIRNELTDLNSTLKEELKKENKLRFVEKVNKNLESGIRAISETNIRNIEKEKLNNFANVFAARYTTSKLLKN